MADTSKAEAYVELVMFRIVCPVAGLFVGIYAVMTKTYEPALLPLIVGLIGARYMSKGARDP